MTLANKSSLGVKMLAGFMGAVAAVSPLGLSNDAAAQEAKAAPVVATKPVTVPTVNARKWSDAFLRVAVARESGDSVVLVVFGNNRELYNRVKKAAEDATAEGYPVKGILVANGKEAAVEIYADAQSIRTHNNPMSVDTEGFVAQTHSAIKHAYTDIILPRREKLLTAQNQPLLSNN